MLSNCPASAGLPCSGVPGQHKLPLTWHPPPFIGWFSYAGLFHGSLSSNFINRKLILQYVPCKHNQQVSWLRPLSCELMLWFSSLYSHKQSYCPIQWTRLFFFDGLVGPKTNQRTWRTISQNNQHLDPNLNRCEPQIMIHNPDLTKWPHCILNKCV